jgi:hypothetical protein
MGDGPRQVHFADPPNQIRLLALAVKIVGVFEQL